LGAVIFDYEDIPPGYYDEVFHRDRGAQSKWHHLKFRRVAQEIAGHRRLLDVGCGPGTFIAHMARVQESVGIDLSSNQIAYAERLYGGPGRRFIRCTAEQLPEEVGRFDAITAIELIEHLSPEEVKATLEAAVRRLEPGGKLVITTPNFGGVWPLVEALVNRFGDVSYEMQHTNKFTRSSLAVLLSMLGLSEPRVSTYLGFAPFAAALGWNLGDRAAEFDARHIEPRSGLLLLGTGLKPRA
jgi:2-polyprenyl-3-methyl-5-hydroxy-6-metoxy-1,4-benzoquinol methylase